MSIVGVLTDSCASIPERLIEELSIKVVPYYIHRRKETLRDLVDVQREEFFRWLATAKELPKTANPGPGDYLEAFKELAQRAEGIISIHMTSLGYTEHHSTSPSHRFIEFIQLLLLELNL